MKTTRIVLMLLVAAAFGTLAYHFVSRPPSAARPTGGLEVVHSSSHSDRTAMETAFANRYAKSHRAKDLDGLMAMAKLDGVGENIVSSMKRWTERSFAQQIVGASFRELDPNDVRELPGMTLEPLLECRISYAQTGPGDVMRSTICILGAEAGHLYVVESANK